MTYAAGPWRQDGHHVTCHGEFTLYVQGVRSDCKSDHGDTARLICAAPDLLAALSRLIAAYETSHSPEDRASCWTQARQARSNAVR